MASWPPLQSGAIGAFRARQTMDKSQLAATPSTHIRHLKSKGGFQLTPPRSVANFHWLQVFDRYLAPLPSVWQTQKP